MFKIKNYLILILLLLIASFSLFKYLTPQEKTLQLLSTTKKTQVQSNPTPIIPTNTIATKTKDPPPKTKSQSKTIAPKTTSTPIPTIITNSKPPDQEVKVDQVTLKITYQETNSYKIDLLQSTTVIDIMKSAQSKKYLNYVSKSYTYGEFINEINQIKNDKSIYWFLYINGKRSPLGASQQKVYTNDIIEWKYEK